MNKNTGVLVGSLIIAFICYIAFSFIQLEFDVTAWDENKRAALVFATSAYAMFMFLLNVFKEENL